MCKGLLKKKHHDKIKSPAGSKEDIRFLVHKNKVGLRKIFQNTKQKISTENTLSRNCQKNEMVSLNYDISDHDRVFSNSKSIQFHIDLTKIKVLYRF